MTVARRTDDGRQGTAGLPVVTLVVAMLSFQYGASVAKGLFPAVGAEGRDGAADRGSPRSCWRG